MLESNGMSRKFCCSGLGSNHLADTWATGLNVYHGSFLLIHAGCARV
jgi:hypothetical protein